MMENNFEEIIGYFTKMAEKSQRGTEVITWLEQKVYQVGKDLYFNNLPNLISNLKEKSPLICISTKKDFIEKYKLSKPGNIYIQFSNDSPNLMDNKFLFSKFIEVIINNMGNHQNFILLISHSTLLSSTEINCNLYNFQAIQQVVNFIDFSVFQMKERTENFKIINFDENKNIWNNLTFINPMAIHLSNHIPKKTGIFDLHFSKTLNSDSIITFTDYLMGQLSKMQ